jgi:hypothetical protein
MAAPRGFGTDGGRLNPGERCPIATGGARWHATKDSERGRHVVLGGTQGDRPTTQGDRALGARGGGHAVEGLVTDSGRRVMVGR